MQNYEAEDWWRNLEDGEKLSLIMKEKPKYLQYSGLMKFAIWNNYNKNPQKLFDKYVEKIIN